jgi:hypothetical protein
MGYPSAPIFTFYHLLHESRDFHADKGQKLDSGRPMLYSKKPMLYSKRPMSFDKRPMSFDKRPMPFDKRLKSYGKRPKSYDRRLKMCNSGSEISRSLVPDVVRSFVADIRGRGKGKRRP